MAYADVVDIVALDDRRNTTQAADNARLLAAIDVVVAHHMMAHGVLVPSIRTRPFDGANVLFGCGFNVVVAIAELAYRDPAAAGVIDRIVLDDPAFAPVGTNDRHLTGVRWRPIGR